MEILYTDKKKKEPKLTNFLNNKSILTGMPKEIQKTTGKKTESLPIAVQIVKKAIKSKKFSEEEYKKICTKIDSFIRVLKSCSGSKPEIALGGSAAKGTLLKDDFDCDIFVRFKKTADAKQNISEELEKILKKTIKKLNEKSRISIERIHGSRDYFRINYKGLTYEIVPVLKISSPEEAENVTDMSVFHVGWIKKELKKKPLLKDEIIAAKLFCKANRLYGAESYIKGFSGHVLDILICYYGSLLGLLKNACSWKKYQVIDIKKHGNIKKLNKAKISPLIVIDPIDSSRNAAAALSYEKFLLFKKKAKEFLAKPSISFFVKKEITEKSLIRAIKKKAENRGYIIIKIKNRQGNKDIIGTMLLKLYQLITKQLKLKGFELKGSGWEWLGFKKAIIWAIADRLSCYRIHTGPPITAKKNAREFMKKHKSYFIKEGRLYAKVKNKEREIGRAALRIIESAEFKEKLMKRISSIEVEAKNAADS